LVEKERVVHVEGREVKAVDTVGAGDSFLGSLGFFLAQGRWDLPECLRRANFVASVSVTRYGTQSSYAHREELPEDMVE
jgi:ribokinase